MILRLCSPVVELVVIVTVGEALEQSAPNGINKQNSHSPPHYFPAVLSKVNSQLVQPSLPSSRSKQHSIKIKAC